MPPAGALAAAAIALAACGAAPSRSAILLPAGARVIARGSLAYAVAFAADGRLASIELEERFALVVRSPEGRPIARHDLGPAERDLPALVVAGDVAWIGGADRRVRGLALADGAVVADWPTGVAVTSLAAADGWLAIGDREGGVCLRRLADGALLQCVQLAAGAIDELAADGAVVIAGAGGRRWALAVPALAIVAVPPTRTPAVRRSGREVHIDGVGATRLGGVVRAIAFAADGRIAVAGWIARLDDPSLVLLPAGPRR
jgi:hypothetical protein